MTCRTTVALSVALSWLAPAMCQSPAATPPALMPPAAATVLSKQPTQGTSNAIAGQQSAAAAPEALPAPAFALTPTASAPTVFNPAAAFAESTIQTTDSGRFWASADYLFGWVQSNELPSLVTTSPAGTPRAQAGVLGSSTTTTLFGGSANGAMRSGFRFEGGYWLDPTWAAFDPTAPIRRATLGMEVGFTMLESQATIFGANSTGDPILARPYLNASTAAEQSVLIAFPGSSTGSVVVRSRSGNFYDGHIDLVENLIEDRWLRIDCLMGYRFFRYDDGLLIQQAIAPTDASFPAGTVLASTDSFITRNTFHGGDFGIRTQLRWQDLTVDLLAKVAAGNVQRRVKIDGNQTTTSPGSAPLVQSGGVYALSSNIGSYSSDDWTVFPEFGTTLSWALASNMKVRLGYSILMMESVARAEYQVSQTVNPNLFPPATTGGPQQPAFNLRTSEVLVQSLNFGFEIHY